MDLSNMNAEKKRLTHHLGKERSQGEEKQAVFHRQKSDAAADPARISAITEAQFHHRSSCRTTCGSTGLSLDLRVKLQIHGLCCWASRVAVVWLIIIFTAFLGGVGVGDNLELLPPCSC